MKNSKTMEEKKLKIDSKTAVNCKTREEAEEVLVIAAEHGVLLEGGTATQAASVWSAYESDTCYMFPDGRHLVGRIGYYRDKGYKIISAQGFIAMHKTDNELQPEEQSSAAEVAIELEQPEKGTYYARCMTDEEVKQLWEKSNKSEQQASAASPTEHQVGGDHYDGAIQPIDYIMQNGIGFAEGNVIKYITRHERKGGAEDIRKAIQYCEFILKYKYQESK